MTRRIRCLPPRMLTVTLGLVAGLGAAVLALAACTGWQDETKGLARQPVATGTGGEGSCIGCNAYFMAASSCAPGACPSPDDVCEGGARDALDAFSDCAFCTACVADCADQCGAGGAGGAAAMSAACTSCVVGTVTGVCATEYAACSQQ